MTMLRLGNVAIEYKTQTIFALYSSETASSITLADVA